MKKIVILVLSLFLLSGVKAQDVFEPLSFLSADEAKTVKKAKEKVSRGESLFKIADRDYQKYKNLATAKKKGKQKKAEKKLVPAKRNIAFAGKAIEQGYRMVYSLYEEKIGSVNYMFPEDKQAAEDLLSEAKSTFESSSKTLKKYESYDNKKFQKSVKYQAEMREVKGAAEQAKQAVAKLYEALQLYDNQESKKQQQSQKDSQAWSRALSANSIAAYQKYLGDFPNGKYVAQARSKIQELEEKIRLAEESQNNPRLVYHVQIMADTHPWSEEDIKSKIYNTNQAITEAYVDGWYKYWIGDYQTYDDAKAGVSRVSRRGAFVVGTINGQPVDILQALEAEK